MFMFSRTASMTTSTSLAAFSRLALPCIQLTIIFLSPTVILLLAVKNIFKSGIDRKQALVHEFVVEIDDDDFIPADMSKEFGDLVLHHSRTGDGDFLNLHVVHRSRSGWNNGSFHLEEPFCSAIKIRPETSYSLDPFRLDHIVNHHVILHMNPQDLPNDKLGDVTELHDLSQPAFEMDGRFSYPRWTDEIARNRRQPGLLEFIDMARVIARRLVHGPGNVLSDNVDDKIAGKLDVGECVLLAAVPPSSNGETDKRRL
jgi:hypothetical protein